MLEVLKKSNPDEAERTHAGVRTLLATVGRRVRDLRTERGMTRQALSDRSGVSPRYLAQLESGAGNISVGLLWCIALALDTRIDHLLRADTPDTPGAAEAEAVLARYLGADAATRGRVLAILDPQRLRDRKAGRICLIGLRGAGKSTLGARVAAELDLPFVELNDRIESRAGMPAAEIIALYGQEGYRDLETGALEEIVASERRMILAAGGGIVSDPATFETLLARFHTVWIKAGPAEHMDRVRAQGDLRPMGGNPQAMIQLRQILKTREAAYRRAGYTLDTSGREVAASAGDLRGLILRNRLAELPPA